MILATRAHSGPIGQFRACQTNLRTLLKWVSGGRGVLSKDDFFGRRPFATGPAHLRALDAEFAGRGTYATEVPAPALRKWGNLPRFPVFDFRQLYPLRDLLSPFELRQLGAVQVLSDLPTTRLALAPLRDPAGQGFEAELPTSEQRTGGTVFRLYVKNGTGSDACLSLMGKLN